MRKITIIVLGFALVGLAGCATGITYVSKEKDVQTGADVYVVRDAITGIAYNVAPAAAPKELPPIKTGQELLLSDRILGRPEVYGDKMLCVVRLASDNNTGKGQDLFIMDKDGSNLKRLTFDGYVMNPKFMWNGNKIAFQYFPGFRADYISMVYIGSKVCFINPDGSDRKDFNNNWTYITSADGNSIEYDVRENDLWRIYVLNNDLMQHKIFETKNKNEVMSVLKWTSEGIFFQVAPNNNSAKWKWLVINPDGTNIKEVSHEYYLSAK